MTPSHTKRAKPVRKTRLSAEARRRQIIESARGVFERSGLAGARTRDIAAAAGINEALLYKHFSSKEELFEAAVGAPLEEAVAAVVALSGQPPDEFDVTSELMHERTLQFVRDLFEVMDEIAALLGIMLFGDSKAAAKYYRTRISPSLDEVRDVVVANLPAWDHRDFDPELTVQMVFGSVWFAVLSDKLTGRRRNRDELAEQITSQMLYGLGT